MVVDNIDFLGISWGYPPNEGNGYIQRDVECIDYVWYHILAEYMLSYLIKSMTLVDNNAVY